MLIKLSAWPCIEIRMQDEVTLQRLKIVLWKGCKSSCTLEKKLINQNYIQEEIKSIYIYIY